MGGLRLTGPLLTAAGLAAALLAAVAIFQRRLIYLPFPREVPPVAAELPGAEAVSLETKDGLRLAGWFAPARGGRSGPAAIVFNGNAGNRSLRAPLASALRDAGLSVLLFDYRGYGGNPGSPGETGLLADARAARRFLASRPEADPRRIVYFGESLGGAVALALTEEVAPAALILRSPFTSLADVGRIHYPFLPVRWLLRDRWPNLDRIGRLRTPVLFVAGERDRIIPAEQTRRLYETAPQPKRLVVIPGADHNDYDLLAGSRMIEAILAFLEETIALPQDLPSAREPLAGPALRGTAASLRRGREA
ncbi:MAG: alpha/beta hydrolase [Acidobacteria bacterium]|nr:alpha/beta hydrolase [Acidobacteriota bacterium]